MNLRIASKIRRAGGYAVSSLVRVLPQPMRFRAAIAIAWLATPLLRPTVLLRQRLAMRMETAREIVTYHLLENLTGVLSALSAVICVICGHGYPQIYADGRR